MMSIITSHGLGKILQFTKLTQKKRDFEIISVSYDQFMLLIYWINLTLGKPHILSLLPTYFMNSMIHEHSCKVNNTLNKNNAYHLPHTLPIWWCFNNYLTMCISLTFNWILWHSFKFFLNLSPIFPLSSLVTYWILLNKRLKNSAFRYSMVF